jgi:hypothetical protein
LSQDVNGFSITVIGLFIAALGVVSPIAWDWYTKKSELTLLESPIVSLVEKKESIDGLLVTYNGREVDSLRKTIFTLKNSGRTPIVDSDLVSPPTITVTGGNILQASIEKVFPVNIGAKLEPVGDKHVSIKFPLLNPGDSVVVGLLVSGEDLEFSAESRVKNIAELQIIDESSQVRLKSSFGWSTYVVGFFTLIFIAVFVTLLFAVPTRNRAFKALRSGATPVKSGESISVVKTFVKNDLRFLTSENQNEIMSLASQSGDYLTDQAAKDVLLKMNEYVSNNNPFAGALIILILLLLGSYYIYSNVIA